MNFFTLNIVFVIFCIFFDNNVGLKVRTPSIFGRRMSQIDSNLTSAFEESTIVPDVIDVVPQAKIQVRYVSGFDVDLGKELTPMSAKDQPSVEWSTQLAQYYTLMMIDPDAPTRVKPTKREIKHWLIINIPGTDITKGETLAVYRGPSPSKGSGLHRFIFLVYKQSSLIKHSETVLSNSSREGRANFNARVFAKRYDLGEPIAANFFVSQYDDYVGLMREKNRINRHNNTVKANSAQDSRLSTRRAQLLDWAPRKPKAPKFPQMVCISYERYQKITAISKEQNKID